MNIIKLIEMNSTFTQILGKLIKNKMFANLKNFENLKEKGQNLALTSQKLARCYRLHMLMIDTQKYTKFGKIGEKVSHTVRVPS